MAKVPQRAVRLVKEQMVSPRVTHETQLRNEERFRAQVSQELMDLKRVIQGLMSRVEALEKKP